VKLYSYRFEIEGLLYEPEQGGDKVFAERYGKFIRKELHNTNEMSR
jgi:hypothetical protein